MGTFFSEKADWYKKGQAIYLYESYKDILTTSSCSKSFVLVNCNECNIEMATSCSNQGRIDIRCDFGCREIHLKTESNKRVAKYYETEEGKKKRTH